MEATKDLNERLKLTGNKGYMISIGLALVLVSSLVIGYYLITHFSEPEGYATVYLLDSQKKAIDYPELLVANLNSTFSVWVGVENHMREAIQSEIQVKITDEPIMSTPINLSSVNTYPFALERDQTDEKSASITINEPGNYSVVFELWISGEFSHNYCVLNIEVVDKL